MRLGHLISTVALALTCGAAELPPCCRDAVPAGEPTERSLYLLDSQWTSDVGKNVRLRVLRCHPQIVALFFTRCEYACPIIVEDMKRIARAMPESWRNDVDFLLVSLDSERDTPQALHDFREKKQLALSHWSLLRGRVDDVRELAALLGVNFRKDERGQFAHSNVISLLNAEGEVVYQQIGLNQNPQPMIDAVRAVLKPVRSVPLAPK